MVEQAEISVRKRPELEWDQSGTDVDAELWLSSLNGEREVLAERRGREVKSAIGR